MADILDRLDEMNESGVIAYDVYSELHDLASQLEERKVGKWIRVSGGCKCPFCDMAFSRLKEDCSDNFCPHCGAKMKGESNNE